MSALHGVPVSKSTKSFLLCSHKGLKHVGTNKRKELDEQSKPITSSLDGSAVSVHQMRKMYPENIDQNLAAKLVAQEYLNVSSVFFSLFLCKCPSLQGWPRPSLGCAGLKLLPRSARVHEPRARERPATRESQLWSRGLLLAALDCEADTKIQPHHPRLHFFFFENLPLNTTRTCGIPLDHPSRNTSLDPSAASAQPVHETARSFE
jgi:hypothetical protein